MTEVYPIAADGGSAQEVLRKFSGSAQEVLRKCSGSAGHPSEEFHTQAPPPIRTYSPSWPAKRSLNLSIPLMIASEHSGQNVLDFARDARVVPLVGGKGQDGRKRVDGASRRRHGFVAQHLHHARGIPWLVETSVARVGRFRRSARFPGTAGTPACPGR